MRPILVFALLLPCGATFAAEPSFYGNPWSANGLANLEVGRFPGRMVSYRFRAAGTGQFVTAKVFFIFAMFGNGAYANGDGGQMRIELRPDDGSRDHFPDMSVAPLSSTLVTDPLNKTKDAPIWGSDSHRSPDARAGGSFREIPFPPVMIQKGRLYHLVFSNPLADPTNYSSLDLLNENRDVTAHIQRAVSDTDWCAVFKPSERLPWKAHPGVTPVMEIRYGDGLAQGLGYIDADAGTPQTIAGASAVRTMLTVSGDDKAVSQMFFRLRRNEGAGDLVVRLEEGDGSPIEEGVVRAADMSCLPLADGKNPAMGWASYTFSGTRMLSLGKTYHLVLRSPQGAGYQTYAMQFGDAYGWTAGNFKDGCYEYTTDGKTWQKVRGSRSFKQQLYFSGIGAAHAQVSAPTSMSLPSTPPKLERFYGVPWEADSLGNLQIGKTMGRMVSYRFRAEQSAKIDRLVVYLVYRAPGYFSGDGGHVFVQLQDDDGSDQHLPSGTTLAACLIKEPMANRRDRGFPHIKFDKDFHLQKGNLYHFVFTNPAFDPVNNYVSIDDLYHNRRHPNVNPSVADLDLAVMYKYSADAKWEHNTGHTPIFGLFFVNGTKQGQGYMDARSQSVLTKVAGDSKAWEIFKVSGNNRLATAVNVRLRKVGLPGELSVTLEEEGKAIWTGKLPPDKAPKDYDWVRLEPDKPLRLRKGKVYRLLLSAPAGDAYEIFPLQKGGQYGFDTPNMFKDGYFDCISGPKGLIDKHDMEMQFCFELK